MKPPRVVLDTNVILSAILCGGNPGEYFALASAEQIVSPIEGLALMAK